LQEPEGHRAKTEKWHQALLAALVRGQSAIETPGDLGGAELLSNPSEKFFHKRISRKDSHPPILQSATRGPKVSSGLEETPGAVY
jgi:hypothetical protein